MQRSSRQCVHKYSYVIEVALIFFLFKREAYFLGSALPRYSTTQPLPDSCTCGRTAYYCIAVIFLICLTYMALFG